MPGYVNGLRHVSLRAELEFVAPHSSGDWLGALEARLVEAFAEEAGPAPGKPPGVDDRALDLAHRILYWVYQLHFAARLPVYETGHARRDPAKPDVFVLHIATVDRAQAIAQEALAWVLDAFNAAASGKALDDCLARLPEVVQRMAKVPGLPTNTPQYLRAAWELGVPFESVEPPIYQLGQAKRSRWMDSTLTDQTSQIAARLARNKVHTAAILRRAGMPGPVHLLVGDADQALTAASRLGYPVVVKPADLDRGEAVAAGLRTPEEVTQAYEVAKKVSPNVLVEKHFHGRDYRVTIFNGQMILAVERIPGGVKGDGKRTVTQLVAELNADPRRGRGKHALMKILDLDAEADSMLAREGLTRDSVPEPGRYVRLRRASNVALGGTPLDVTAQVHPDNRDLAIRATAALRLDFGGVDFVIPDLARSWLETGALICEINSQPSIGVRGAHVFADVIRSLVEGDGRIPIAVIIGAAETRAMGTSIANELEAAGVTAGWADRDGATIAGQRASAGALTAFQGAQVVLADNCVGALVLFVNGMGLLRTGLPFARFDVLAFAGTKVAAPKAGPEQDAATLVAQLEAALAPACDGTVLRGVEGRELLAAVVHELREADARHAIKDA